MHVCMLSCVIPVQLFVTPWTVARHASLSMGFSRQEYWSGLPFPPPVVSPSWPRDWSLVSCVSCIAGRFFFYWLGHLRSPKMLKKSSNSFRYCSLRNHWIPLEELLIPKRQIKLIFFLAWRKFHTDSWKLHTAEFNVEMNKWGSVVYYDDNNHILVVLHVFSFYYIKKIMWSKD